MRHREPVPGETAGRPLARNRPVPRERSSRRWRRRTTFISDLSVNFAKLCAQRRHSSPARNNTPTVRARSERSVRSGRSTGATVGRNRVGGMEYFSRGLLRHLLVCCRHSVTWPDSLRWVSVEPLGPGLAQLPGFQPGREVPDDHCYPIHRARHDPARLLRPRTARPRRIPGQLPPPHPRHLHLGPAPYPPIWYHTILLTLH